MVEKGEDIRLVTSEILRRVNEDNRRIRLLEQRMDRIDGTVGGLEDNVLSELDELKIGVERLSDKILKIGEKLKGIEDEIERLRKDLGKTATKSEVKQIETFMDIVNPITSKFITREEIERILDERSKLPKRA